MRLKTTIAFVLLSKALLGADFYVDQVSGTDSVGGGTSDGTAYATIQYALNDIGTTHGKGASGDQIHIKVGTPTSLTGSLDFTTYGAPGSQTPLVFRGYTATARDGGIGSILGNGTNPVLNGTQYTNFVDLEINGAGVADHIIFLGGYSTITNCEVHNCDLAFKAAIQLDGGSTAYGCHVYDAQIGISAAGNGTAAIQCYLSNEGTIDFVHAIRIQGPYGLADGNIISIDGASNGIFFNSNTMGCRNNTIYGGGSGTGDGISTSTTYTRIYCSGNHVEGFGGVGGSAFTDGGETDFIHFTSNSEYGNTTGFDSRHTSAVDEGNETLTSSGLAKSGIDTFANRFVYFAPLDGVGSLWGGNPFNPTRDRGAVQHAGGGTPTSTIYNQTRP